MIQNDDVEPIIIQSWRAKNSLGKIARKKNWKPLKDCWSTKSVLPLARAINENDVTFIMKNIKNQTQ